MRRKQQLVLILLLVVISVPALAQRQSATIRGTVTDETGAVLPGATVTVTGTDTGLSRVVYTNPSGIFTFDLPVGTYSLTVELEGFKKAVVSAIELNVADERRLDVGLELGDVVEEITTTASAIHVETIGGEVTGLVRGEQIRELPLNGRNFVQLTLLMPGVSAIDGFNTTNKGLMTGVDMSVSGSAVTNNLWTIDGANNNDVGSNRTILVYPSIDAIEEFKIHRNAYGAEFGQAAGGQINIVTRGGTNQLSGSASYFRRDDSWNEPNYFLERAGLETEPLDRDDFGWTLGGAMVRDKLHFFVSQEYNSETRGIARGGFVPTAAERNGDFSGPRIPGCSPPVPVDPLTGQPFPGNVIPADRLSDAGLSFLRLYPLPNVTPGAGDCNNWVAAVSTPIDFRQDNLRFDWSVTDRSRLMVRFTQDDWDNGSPNGGAENGLWGDDPFPAVDSNWDQPSHSFVVQLNQTIGSKAVNTVQYSFSGNQINITRGGDDPGLNAEITAAIPALFGDKAGGSDVSHPVFWGGQGYAALWNAAPWNNKQDLHVLKDDYHRVFGKHWVKVGALYSQNKKNELIGGASAAEAPAFWGSAGLDGWGGTSGNILADFLLEDMTFGFSEIGFQPNSRVRWEDLEVYVGDSWQVGPNMTLDLGLRYSRYFEPYSEDDNIAGFRPELFDPALGSDPCNGLLVAGSADPCAEAGFLGGTAGPRSLVDDDTDNLAPRLGFAWDVFGTGKSALRAGFGQFYQRNRVSVAVEAANNPPFIARQTGIRKLDETAEPCGGCFSLGFGFPARGLAADFPTPYEWHWNVMWEQELRPNMTVEFGYVGSRGVHLLRRYDLNQVPAGDNNGNGVSDRLEWVRLSGDGAAQGNLRPFSAFGNNTILFWENDGKSIYHSLQAHFVTRFGRGSHFQASYTWSDSEADDPLTDSGAGTFPGMVTDLSDPDLDYAHSGIHREHVANASLVMFTPDFADKNAFVKNVFGNWQIGTIVLWSTGTPITVYTGTIPGLSDGGSGTGFNGNQRPNLTGQPCRGGSTDISFLNPDAFTLEGFELGSIGNAGRGVCTGPSFFQVDLSLYKNIRITDRFNLQFRFEVFNVFDRTNFLNIDNTLDPISVTLDNPDQAQATRIVSYEIPANFGQATRARDPRQVQLGLRLTW